MAADYDRLGSAVGNLALCEDTDVFTGHLPEDTHPAKVPHILRSERTIQFPLLKLLPLDSFNSLLSSSCPNPNLKSLSRYFYSF